jgi:hypothetical protein
MKFLIGFLVTIGLLIVVFVLIFRGAANNNETTPQTKLVDYANTSTVMQFTQKGPVQADQTFGEIRITVSDQEVAIETFQGYGGTLVTAKTYNNNTAAYADFLAALDRAGYTHGNTDKALADDRGACATGSRFIMGIKNGDEDVQRFWSSSCGKGANPSFEGSTQIIVRLFHAQVPDYIKLTANLHI